MITLTRRITTDLIQILKREQLFNDKLQFDIAKGKVLPAIRNKRIDFYFGGGKLFQFDRKGFNTHIKYAAVIPKKGSDYLTEDELKHQNLACPSNNRSRMYLINIWI